ncbi:uncharacterized protein ACWYII_039650 [Salvelinus alpinus]
MVVDFRKQLKSPKTLTNFYRCTIKSILSGWYRNCTALNRKALQKVVRYVQRITGGKLPALHDTYSTRCHRKAKKIIKDINHPSHCLFTPLPSRRQDLCLNTILSRSSTGARSRTALSVGAILQLQGSPEGGAQHIIGAKLHALQDTYSTRCHRNAKKIIKDNNHPSHCLLTPLSSRRQDNYFNLIAHNCGTLRKQVCAFPNHVQSIELTTGVLQSSCRNISMMINGSRMHLSSNSSLIAKGSEYLCK